MLLSHASIISKVTITITEVEADSAARITVERIKQIIFKICGLFTYCISEVNNAQVDNAKNLDVLMTMYYLIEFGDSCSKISGSL